MASNISVVNFGCWYVIGKPDGFDSNRSAKGPQGTPTQIISPSVDVPDDEAIGISRDVPFMISFSVIPRFNSAAVVIQQQIPCHQAGLTGPILVTKVHAGPGVESLLVAVFARHYNY